MGSWGTALYSNDISSDVRDMCNEVYPLLGAEEGTKLVLKEFDDVINSDIIDNEYANFWFALADWQWKHGILTDEIKSKTITLLDARTGIEEWEEDGSAVDIKKRIAVMDKLLMQLNSPQPEMKIPKAKSLKPKHKLGEIIVFRTCSNEYKYANRVWRFETEGYCNFYADEIADAISKLPPIEYEAHEKYMSIICVGYIEEPYSQYVPDVMRVHSIYALYDYISDERPTLDDLKKCGFLPFNLLYTEDIDGVGKNAWAYTFNLYSQSFLKKAGGAEQVIEIIPCLDERDRFQTLLDKKHYDNEHTLYINLNQAFCEIYNEKVRLEHIGIELDNLLDEEKSNPDLRPPKRQII